MNYTDSHLLRLPTCVGVVVISSFAASFLFASASAQGSADNEDVYTLSPFTVNGKDDVGYRANSTLAGSRTNTEIKDIANPLDIFTAELMEDLAVQDIQDLTSLANGVEPNGAGDYNTEGQEVSVWNYNYMQIRGFKVGSATRNFMDLNTTFESYNSERVEFSKGPNAVLFGAGSPGGSTNYSTKNPILAEDAFSIQHRMDDLGSQRVSMDLNKVLVEEKLAIRLNGLWEDRAFYREPSYEEEEAWHLVGTWKPNANTTFTLGHEKRNTDKASPRGAFSQDRVSGWIAAGSPIVTDVPSNGNVVVEGETNNQSAGSLGMETRNSDNWVLDSDGVLRNTRGTARGVITEVNDVNMDTVSTGFDFPYDQWSGGPNGISDTDWDITEFNLTHRVNDDFYIDFSYGKSNSFNRTGQSVSRDIYIDPNDFDDNQHGGEYYVESRPFRIDRGIDIEDLRLTASYHIDLSESNKWFGDHQLALMFEQHEREEWWDNGRLTLTETPDGPSTGNLRSGNLAFYLRDYIDPENGVYSMHDYRDLYYSDGINQDGYKAEFLRRESWAALRTMTDQDTTLGVLQSRWFENRLITTIGWRQDKRVFYEAPFTADSVTQLSMPVEVVSGAPEGTTEPRYAAFIDPASSVNGISRNYGGVYHVNNWFSLTANYATNFSPSTQSRDLYGDFVTASTGESTDYGVRFNLMEDRLNISLLKFETSELDSITNGDSINSPIKSMKFAETILVENGIIDVSALAKDGNHTTADRTAEGEELLIIGNPSDNWNLRFSASRLVNEQRNIAPDIRSFFAERIPFYEAQDGSMTSAEAGTDLATRIVQAKNAYALMETRENVKVFPASEFSGRFTAKYSFDRDTKFKGISIGSTASWTSSPVIGYYKTVDGVFDVNRYYEGDDRFEADLFFTYKRKLGENIDWRLQLNIDNLFDDSDPLAVSAINDSDAADFNWVVYRYRPQNGRVFTLTNTFSF